MRVLFAVVWLTGCTGTPAVESPPVESPPPAEVPEAVDEEADLMLRIADAPTQVGVGDAVPLHLEASKGGKNVDPGEVQWVSSDEGIAKVDEAGRLVGVAKGTAYLTAKSAASEAMIEVEVTAK